ncbi:hypothetical protein EZS27_028040 [termite gut metagenome]|uniref:NTP pyrophosphohydrolase MazG-like domain-containing protein n=1 Tax=termite gut metagenome TaxID=433724 RepID=A0A5J4QN45_9ZZZZ
MELSAILKIQKDFDSQHKINFNWDEHITEDNLLQLQFLMIALMGEVGEMANYIKKIVRGDMKYEQQKNHISEELVDIFIYVIKLTYQMDIDLESEYFKKLEFNKIRFNEFNNHERF